MTPKEMEASCLAVMERPGGFRVTFTTAKGQKMPPGFPRGEVLSETPVSVNRSYKPEKVLRWLRTHMLIESFSETAPSRRK